MVVTPNKRAKGDGSVFQRKDGRWVAELPLPEKDGKRRSMSKYAKTEAQAKALLTQMRRDKIKAGGDLITGSINVAALMERWLREVAEKENKAKSVNNARSVIANHINPVLGKTPLDKLNRSHFERLTASIEAKGLTATALLAHTTLSAAVKYGFKSDLIDSDVSLKATRPSAAPAELAVLTADQGLNLLRTVGQDRLGSRVAAALLTGGRQGELLGLELDRVGDNLTLSWQLQRISWQHGCGTPKTEQYTNNANRTATRHLWPCGEGYGATCPDRKVTFPRNSEHRHLTGGLWLIRPKSKAGWRVLPLRGALRTVIERRVDVAATEPNPHGLLWTSDPKKDKHGRTLPLDGSPIDPRIDNEYWHNALVRAGLEQTKANGSIDKLVRLHSARHTGASLFLGANVPEKTIMELMGHSSFAVTRRYQHVSLELASAAMEDMGLQLNYDPDEPPQIEQ